MRLALSLFAILPLMLTASGCAQLAAPDPGLLPPVPGPATEANLKLRDLPPPAHPVAVAVYGYGDQTGQFKPIQQGANVQSLSRAVTQGATSILIKALQDAGSGRWFTVVERERLDNLLKERRIIADMRARYLGEQAVNPDALPPMLFAGVLIDGGIIGYDSNSKTGGAGANYFGLGGDVNYSEDTVTVYLRGTSVKTGQVLLSVVATKKILSYGVDANLYRYVTFNRLLQAELGFTHNEPGSLAVEQAIEQAVLQFIIEGSARGLWAFKDRGFQSQIIGEYELNYLAAAQESALPNGDGAPQKAAASKAQTPSAKAAATAAAKQPKPVQQASLMSSTAPQPQPQAYGQQPQQSTQQRTAIAAGAAPPPSPQVIVQPRTLEDEVPISPR